MRVTRWILLAVLAASAVTGCKGNHKRKYAVYPEAAPCSPVEGGAPVVEGGPMLRPLSFVDRHPLLYKPRDTYEDTDYNPIVKTAAAVIVGVPAGIVGEVRQMVAGNQPKSNYDIPSTTQ